MKKADWVVLLPTQTDLAIGTSEKEQEQTLLSLFGRSRRSVIGSHVKIRKKTGDDFWKVYQDFQERKQRFLLSGQERRQTDVSQTSDNVTEKTGAKKNKKYPSDITKLYECYFKRFSKLIGRKQAFRLLLVELQMESSLSALVFLKERSVS